MKTDKYGLTKDFGWLVEDARDRAEKFRLNYVVFAATYPRRWWWPFRTIRYGKCLLSMLQKVISAYATERIVVTEWIIITDKGTVLR